MKHKRRLLNHGLLLITYKKINNKNIWPETKMIISLDYKQFKAILNNLNKNPQGSFKPDLKPYRVDNI